MTTIRERSTSGTGPRNGLSTFRCSPTVAEDTGSSTIVGLALAVGLLVLVGVLGLAGLAFSTHVKADGAADLAALAAADAARGLTPGEPCALAEHITEEAGAELVECIVRPDLGRAGITVELDVPGSLGSVEATAVAGVGE